MGDILDDLKDLQKQATTEKSYYYVAEVVERAIQEIETSRSVIKTLQEKEQKEIVVRHKIDEADLEKILARLPGPPLVGVTVI